MKEGREAAREEEMKRRSTMAVVTIRKRKKERENKKRDFRVLFDGIRKAKVISTPKFFYEFLESCRRENSDFK